MTETLHNDIGAQIDAIKADPSHPYWNKADPLHKVAVHDMANLYARRNGDEVNEPSAPERSILSTMADPRSPVWDRTDPRHDRAVNDLLRDYEAASDNRPVSVVDRAAIDSMAPPESPQGYDLDRFRANLPPEVMSVTQGGLKRVPMEWDDALEHQARTWFHDAELNQGEVSGVLASFDQALRKAPIMTNAERDQAAKLTVQALLQEWGQDYTTKLDGARRAMRSVGGQDLADFLEATGLGNDAYVVRLFARLAERKHL